MSGPSKWPSRHRTNKPTVPANTAPQVNTVPTHAAVLLTKLIQYATVANTNKAHIHNTADCEDSRYFKRKTESARVMSPYASPLPSLYSQMANNAVRPAATIRLRRGCHSQAAHAKNGTAKMRMPFS